MARMEIISGVERRRRWSKEAKLAILAEADRERYEQPTAFGVDGIAIALSFRTSALPASA